MGPCARCGGVEMNAVIRAGARMCITCTGSSEAKPLEVEDEECRPRPALPRSRPKVREHVVVEGWSPPRDPHDERGEPRPRVKAEKWSSAGQLGGVKGGSDPSIWGVAAMPVRDTSKERDGLSKRESRRAQREPTPAEMASELCTAGVSDGPTRPSRIRESSTGTTRARPSHPWESGGDPQGKERVEMGEPRGPSIAWPTGAAAVAALMGSQRGGWEAIKILRTSGREPDCPNNRRDSPAE
jgi:hypothetical protein